jgi:hypothetical protein
MTRTAECACGRVQITVEREPLAVLTDSLARGMGFDDVDDFDQQRKRMGLALRERAVLSRWDWTRILIAAEIVFVSDVVGSGVEWATTTGQTDADTLDALRGLQRKLGPVRLSLGPRSS